MEKKTNKANQEIRELDLDELSKVSGGNIVNGVWYCPICTYTFKLEDAAGWSTAEKYSIAGHLSSHFDNDTSFYD